jgi:uncharacterized membrane protein YeaQ/YmgE (transglycosylase-associated protein family)
MFHFLGWLIVGLIAGAVARLLMPGRDPMGLLATMILGIAGSIIGGLVGGLIWAGDRGFQPGGLILSLLGAILLLGVWRMVKSRNTVQ